MENKIIVANSDIKKILDDNGVFYFSDEDEAPVEMDSITFISLIIGLEEQYGIDIPASNVIEPPGTYGKLVDYLAKIVYEEYSRDDEGKNAI